MKLSPVATLLSVAVATALCGAPFNPAAADAAANPDQVSIELGAPASRWFVELAGPPTVKGVPQAAVGREQAAFRKAARDAGIEFSDRFVYQTLWNGLSVETSTSNAAKLRAVPGVRAVYPVVEVAAPPTPDLDAIGDVASAIALTRSDIARNSLGLTGEGIKVAIIDTGIDYDHPDLGGCFGPNCKVAYGYDFVGNAYNSSDPNNNVPMPGNDPDDCNGHGTHVAGIVGAAAATPDGVSGVAPGVTLGAYKVFGCTGSSSADVIVASLERAYADGMQIINQSLGAAFQWPDYPTSIVGDRLVEQGVVVIASAGNSGASGTFSNGAPGVGRDIIGVSSFNNTRVTLPAFTVNPAGRVMGYNRATGAPLAPLSGEFPLARTGTTTTADDACGTVTADVAGKIALVRRGTCAFYNKALNAQNAGAIGVVLYNNAAGRISPTVAQPTPADPAITIPVVSITAADGAFIDAGLQAGTVTLDWATRQFQEPNAAPGLTSTFSSWGMSPDLEIKPDLGAPGGSIYATYPLELGGYASLSGTSMSAPHVAGAVALLLQARPGIPAAEVRDLLQNTSVPQLWSGNAASGLIDPVHRQGAGMIDIVAAVESSLLVSPGKLSLGESEAGPHSVRLTLRNSGAEAVTLLPSFLNTVTTTRSISTTGNAQSPGPNNIGYFLSDATVEFGSEAVTVPAGGLAVLDAVITPSSSPQDAIYGGYIVLTEVGGRHTVRVPFAGYIGDYQAIQPLDGSPFGFPWLARLEGTSLFRLDDGEVFTLVDGDLPYFLVMFGHHVRRVEFQVIDATSGRPVHPVFSNFIEIDYVGRNATRSTFFSFNWDGLRFHSAGNSDLFQVVPNGNYRVNVRALKALGDASNPDHWQIWTSPSFVIERPEEPKKKVINLRGNGGR